MPNSTKAITHFTTSPITLYCGGWRADDSGVYRVEESNNGQMKQHMACPHPILPVERLVNIDNRTEKLRLAYYRDGKWQYITVDCTTCYNKQNIVALADRGIFVTSETSRELVRYLSDMVRLNMYDTGEDDKIKAIPVCSSVGHLGWIDDDFMPYLDNIRYDGDMEYVTIYNNITAVGDKEIWMTMAKEIRKHTLVRLLMAASFGSVLIERVGTLPFVFHLWGTTSFGKTTCLMVAMSIWGSPKMGELTRSLNATANGMARTAAFMRNLPVGCDELQQVKNPKENYDNMIMYLTEGIDRNRAKAGGGIEETKTWHNCFIFTGEQPITQESSGGGVKNRVIEVEVTAAMFDSGYDVANTLKENYGFAGPVFVAYVQTLPKKALRDQVKQYVDQIMAVCDTTDKQAYSMGVMLLADRLACQCLFPDEEPLTVDDVRIYLRSNKTVDAAERAYEWCMNWVAKNSNRFTPTANDVYGKMDETYVWIIKDVLVRAMRDAGFELNAVSRKWAEAGYLVKNTQGRNMHRISINGVHNNCIKLSLPEVELPIQSEPVPEERGDWIIQQELY